MLRVVLALAVSGMAAQMATGIHLQDVRFKGETQLDGVDLKKCASDLKSQAYVGTDWIDYFVGTVQTKCLLDKGYFKSVVTASTRQLPEKTALTNLPSHSISTQVRDTVSATSHSKGTM